MINSLATPCQTYSLSHILTVSTTLWLTLKRAKTFFRSTLLKSCVLMVQKTASARTFSEIFKFDCHLLDFEQSNPINWQNTPAHNHYSLNCWSFCNHTLMIHHYELECKRISSLENKGDLTLGTPRRPEAQSGLTVRPAGKVQCQGGRTKPYRPHLHWSKLHLWGNTISWLLGFQTHTQDMHQSLFCIRSLSTNLGSGQNSNVRKGNFSFQFPLTGGLADSYKQLLNAFLFLLELLNH